MKNQRNPGTDSRSSPFKNPAGNPQFRGFSTSMVRTWARFAADMARLRYQPSPFGPEHRLTPEQTLAGWQQCRAERAVTWLGHASFLLRIGDSHLLTDPFLSDYASPAVKRLEPPALRATQIPALDAILLSHNHYDHLDVASLKVLAQRFPDTAVHVPLGLGPLLQRCGFTQVRELDWYDTAALNDLQIQAVPALHMSRRGLTDQNKTLWCGFALEQGDWRGYFAGDTAYGPVFEELGAYLGAVDLALVPIGAYAPRRIMKPVHATPEEAVRIAEHLHAGLAIGMHWGSIRLTTEPMDEPPKRFLAAESPVPRRVLRLGETLGV